MLLSEQIEEQNQKQINVTLKISEKTLLVLNNLQGRLNNNQMCFEGNQRIRNIISDFSQSLYIRKNQINKLSNQTNLSIVNVLCNELLQQNKCVLLHLMEELNYFKINTHNDDLKEQVNELNKTCGNIDKQKKKFQYQKLLRFKSNKIGFGYLLEFNIDGSLLFSRYDNGKIIIYGFNNTFKLIQILSKSIKFQADLPWIKKQNTITYGCTNQSNPIKNNFSSYQNLIAQQAAVNCLIMNQEGDLLISGSEDETIKFWRIVDAIWTPQQSINIQFKVLCLSLNASGEKLISCGQKNEIMIIERKSDQQWIISQKIPIDFHGLHLSFVNNDQFIFQPITKEQLEIFNYNKGKQQFMKIKSIQFIYGSEFRNIFKFKVIAEKCLIVIQHQWYIILIQYNENWDYNIQQVKKCKNLFLWGQIKENGQFLITWDDKTYEIQVQTLKCLD